MTLLWTKVAAWALDGETHDEHAMHPAFEAAGIRHSPCCFSRCPEQDLDHTDDFDEAEERLFSQKGNLPVHRLDLSQPLHGFEHTADMHTIRRYTSHPENRKGLPVVFRSQGNVHIMNGHHGLTAALRRGDSHADVHMIDLDAKD